MPFSDSMKNANDETQNQSSESDPLIRNTKAVSLGELQIESDVDSGSLIA